MSFKTTRKSIVNSTASKDLLSVGYCGLATLLQNHSPIAYTGGTYGRNFDVYVVYGLTICTRYRGMVGKRLEGISEAENKARDILSWENTAMTYDEKREAVEKVLKSFCLANGGHDF